MEHKTKFLLCNLKLSANVLPSSVSKRSFMTKFSQIAFFIRIPTPLMEVGELYINLYPLNQKDFSKSCMADFCFVEFNLISDRQIKSLPTPQIPMIFCVVILFLVLIFIERTFWQVIEMPRDSSELFEGCGLIPCGTASSPSPTKFPCTSTITTLICGPI